jgi:hypothetical protein
MGGTLRERWLDSRSLSHIQPAAKDRVMLLSDMRIAALSLQESMGGILLKFLVMKGPDRDRGRHAKYDDHDQTVSETRDLEKPVELKACTEVRGRNVEVLLIRHLRGYGGGRAPCVICKLSAKPMAVWFLLPHSLKLLMLVGGKRCLPALTALEKLGKV